MSRMNREMNSLWAYVQGSEEKLLIAARKEEIHIGGKKKNRNSTVRKTGEI